MKKIVFILFIFCSYSALAQQDILEQIEQNNTVLSALRKQADAEKIANKTGIYLENPEIGYHYLWGNNAEMGNRTDFEVSQSFDFPTTYSNRKKVANAQNKQVDLKYLLERKEILLEAEMICIQLTYHNALSKELEKQLVLTQEVADAYKTKFDKGDANALELNKAKYDLLNAQKDYRASITEKEFLEAELIRLNSGNAIDYTISAFSEIQLPVDFGDWYRNQKEKNILLQYYQQEVWISQKNEKLQRSLNLPKFSAGYMSEKVLTEHFQGVTIGVSIPLWENKNTIKQVKAQTVANQQMELDANLRDYHQSEALYKKAANLQLIVNDFKTYQLSDNTADLLKRALDAGEIDLIGFILELGIYYDLVQDKLETERDLHLAVAELMQWERD